MAGTKGVSRSRGVWAKGVVSGIQDATKGIRDGMEYWQAIPTPVTLPSTSPRQPRLAWTISVRIAQASLSCV